MKIKSDYSNEPQWKEVNVKSSLPKELACLDEIAHNLWFGWTHEARPDIPCRQPFLVNV